MKLQTRKIISFLTALTLLLAVALPAGAAKTPDAGTYSVKSTLSCFVDAMGGQEFGAKLYKGAKITVDKNGSAKAFAEEMVRSGTVAAIRREDGNLRYEYFFPMDDPETVLLIDQWRDQAAIDVHHASPMMAQIAALREKYDLHMKVERFVSDDSALPEKDMQFIKR